MLEVIREQFLFYSSMENYLTAGDLALIENRRNYGYGEGCGCGCGYGYRHRDGMAATGIGLAAGLGGAALLGVIAIGWGINKASEARSNGAMQANTLLANNLNQMSSLLLAERSSREGWQTANSPSIRNYVDIQSGALAGAGASSTSNALAQAEAQIVANALTGVSQRCPTPVALYSAPQPCPCVNSCCNG